MVLILQFYIQLKGKIEMFSDRPKNRMPVNTSEHTLETRNEKFTLKKKRKSVDFFFFFGSIVWTFKTLSKKESKYSIIYNLERSKNTIRSN